MNEGLVLFLLFYFAFSAIVFWALRGEFTHRSWVAGALYLLMALVWPAVFLVDVAVVKFREARYWMQK